MLVPVGIAMGTMGSIDASCPRIKLVLRPTKGNGRKRRKRNLDLDLLLLVVNNMRDQGLVVVEAHKSPVEAASKNSTTSGVLWQGLWMELHPYFRVSCCFHFQSIFLSLSIACNPSLSSKDCKRTASSRACFIPFSCSFSSSSFRWFRQ